LSAPFRSRGFRWNFLPALPRSFVARSRPIPIPCRDGACPVSPRRERNSTSKSNRTNTSNSTSNSTNTNTNTNTNKDHGVEERSLETRFSKKHAGKKPGKKDYRCFHQPQETA
jgi:hypothetical protein